MPSPNIHIHITRDDLIERDACADEIAHFDRICAANPDRALTIEGTAAYVNSTLLVFFRYWHVGVTWARCHGLIPAIDFRDADLTDADLRRANLADTILVGADLWHANLEGANLTGACLTGAYLRYANLRGANLRYADLRLADLGKANLRGADLTGADLTGADLTDATMPTGWDEIVRRKP